MTHIYITFVDIDDVPPEESPDPLDVFIHKVEALAELLGCTEEQAEHLILQRL